MQSAYVEQLLRETEGASALAEAYVASTVFIGGGTPSILPARQIPRILGKIREIFPLRKDAEITIEANPGTMDAEKLHAWREAGVNRLSIGLQSADNRELRRLGRIHTWEEFLEGFRQAREAGFSNINVDLMSGIPGQTLVSWETSLRKTAELGPEHISAYSLILEEGT